MRFLAFGLKKEFPRDDKVDEKKFCWWKIVVASLAVVATGLLVTTFVLANGLPEFYRAETTLPSFLNFGKNMSDEAILEISSRVLPMSKVYCSIQNCVVKCSGIPAASSPGIVASVFADSEYQTLCPGKELIEELIFDNCRFLNKKLSSGWLPTKFQLKKLTLKRCALEAIDSDAFDRPQFSKLSGLTITENVISVLEKSFFDSLTNLSELVITNNVIRVAEANLLAGTAKTLEILKIDKSIYSERVLENIVGSISLPRVLLLSLTGNNLGKISSDVFKGVPNVHSVYLSNSGISSIEANAFDHFSGSISQLFLSGNSISHLPRGIFEPILNSNPNFKVALANNDWNCDCELEWLQNAMEIFSDEPRCSSPENNAMLVFSAANFCRDEYEVTKKPVITSNADETTQPIYPGNVYPEKDGPLLTLTCDEVNETSTTFGRKLLSTRELKFQSKFNGFFIEEEPNGTVYVSLSEIRSAYTLIWFESNLETENIDSGQISCLTNVKKSLYLMKLRPDVSYTICLLQMFGMQTSPLNCLPFRKGRSYEELVWLENKDKPTFFAVFSVLLVFVCATSIVGSYLVLLRNPKLLKGSKRIIMVSHCSADAIVLPEGVRLNSGKDPESQRSKEYVNPMSQRWLLARRTSVTSEASSRSSTMSYVSGIQPTKTQLMSWRIGRIKEILSRTDRNLCDNPTPPILPPRNQSIPSLSLNLDERRASQEQRTPVVTFNISSDYR